MIPRLSEVFLESLPLEERVRFEKYARTECKVILGGTILGAYGLAAYAAETFNPGALMIAFTIPEIMLGGGTAFFGYVGLVCRKEKNYEKYLDIRMNEDDRYGSM